MVFGAEVFSCVSVQSQSVHRLALSVRCLQTEKKNWKCGPCLVLLCASLHCRQGFICKLKHELLLHRFWLAMQFFWSDHLLISCSLREIEFSLPFCVPSGSLKAILCVWHLNVGAFVVICPVTSFPTAGKNPSIHLHKTYLTWTSGQQNFSQGACIAQPEVGCLTVTSFAGCSMLTKVHTVRPLLKKHFPQKTFSQL